MTERMIALFHFVILFKFAVSILVSNHVSKTYGRHVCVNNIADLSYSALIVELKHLLQCQVECESLNIACPAFAFSESNSMCAILNDINGTPIIPPQNDSTCTNPENTWTIFKDVTKDKECHSQVSVFGEARCLYLTGRRVLTRDEAINTCDSYGSMSTILFILFKCFN